MSGVESYDHGRKHTWRGWQWNLIVNRLPELRDATTFSARDAALAAKDKIVIYLCGSRDFDRQCGLARGFLNHNMIAVDVSEANIRRIRRRGGLGICGRLEHIIARWPSDWHIDVIIADLCSGLSKQVDGLIGVMRCSQAVTDNTVIAMNLFRGRDEWANPFRETIDSLSFYWKCSRQRITDDIAKLEKDFRPRRPTTIWSAARQGQRRLMNRSERRAAESWVRKNKKGELEQIDHERAMLKRDLRDLLQEIKEGHDYMHDSGHRGKLAFALWRMKSGEIFGPIGQMPEFASYDSLGNSSAKMDSVVFIAGKHSVNERPVVIAAKRDTPFKIAALRAVRTKMMQCDSSPVGV